MITQHELDLVRVTAANTLRQSGHPTLADLVERTAKELALFQPESDWDPEITEAQKLKLLANREQLREVGRYLKGKVPFGWGFMLLFFEYGEKGLATYLSTAHRADTANVLEEMVTKLRARPEP